MQSAIFVTVRRQSHGDGLIQIKEPNRPICFSKIILRGRILLGPNFKAAEFGGLSICSKSAPTATSGSSKNYSEPYRPDVCFTPQNRHEPSELDRVNWDVRNQFRTLAEIRLGATEDQSIFGNSRYAPALSPQWSRWAVDRASRDTQ